MTRREPGETSRPSAGFFLLARITSCARAALVLELTFMSIKPPLGTSDLPRALDAVLAVARAQGLDQKSLAARAGVRAETITRAKTRGVLDWNTLRALAGAAGLDLQVLALPRRPASERSSLADASLKLAWSNPNASTTTLIAKAIENRSFDLILQASKEHGIDTVAAVANRLREEQAVPAKSLDYADRALRNISIGAQRVLAGSH